MTNTTAVALVTGASGFLGRHVTAQLAAQGVSVVSLGRTIPSQSDITRHLSLADVSDKAAIRQALTEVKPNLVLNLAGSRENADHREAFAVNTIFAANLLDVAAQLQDRPSVLLVGTAAEYGQVAALDLPVTEGSVCRPITSYGISKLAQTMYGLAAADSGLAVVVARLFNIVGGGMPKHLALGSFAAQIRAFDATGGTLKTGPLDRERDFIDVTATARILIELASNPEASGQVVNICSGRATNLRIYVDALIEVSGKPIMMRSNTGPYGPRDMLRHWGSNDRLHSLGYSLPAADPRTVAAALLRRLGTP